MRRTGAIVAISGMDSAGKRVHRDLLVAELERRGHPYVVLWTRAGYTRRLETMKRLLGRLRGRRKRSPSGAPRPGSYPKRAATLGGPLRRRAWLTAALLDLLVTYAVQVRWWRARGLTVLCDRYLLDCLVDLRVNFPGERVEERLLGRLLRRGSPTPDRAFCLLVTPEESERRSAGKGRRHREPRDVLERRYEAYRSLAPELGCRVLDAGEAVERVGARIRRDLPWLVTQPGLSRP